jgi:dihydroneopterin aldolase
VQDVSGTNRFLRPLTPTKNNRRPGRESAKPCRQRDDSGRITIRELEVRSRIGVPVAERKCPQRLLVTVEMEIDCGAAARGDDMAKAVDYVSVAAAIKREAVVRPRKLIETLAEDIARCVLDHFGVRQVTVELEKFPFKDARSVSVRITRSQYA